MNLIKKLAVVIVALGSVSVAQADPITIIDLVGDKDCFGFGEPCSDGLLVVTGFGPDGDSLVEPDDPLGTDQLGTPGPLGGPSFDFLFDVTGYTPISASVTIFTAGIDLGGGPQFLFNGTNIGSYVEPFDQRNLAATVIFDVPIDLLWNQNNLTLSFTPLGNSTAIISDGHVIDYVELAVVVNPCSPFPGGGNTGGCFPGPGPFPVPEPATLALFGLGLAGIGFSRRKKA